MQMRFLSSPFQHSSEVLAHRLMTFQNRNEVQSPSQQLGFTENPERCSMFLGSQTAGVKTVGGGSLGRVAQPFLSRSMAQLVFFLFLRAVLQPSCETLVVY